MMIPAKRTLGLALVVCALLLTMLAAWRANLDYRARHFARAFIATTRSDVPVTLHEQILYSVFYSASQPDSDSAISIPNPVVRGMR